MGRDRKTSITQEASKIVFPGSRRSSITSSFSLPSLSLSSRSKPTPVLTPLDTSRANTHPLDSGGATSSFITPSANALELSHSPSHSVSPMKPPASPGTSAPLPSIRSLRSRFSFHTQEPPNLPGIALQAPTQKRTTTRRFLPFGGSGSSNQSANSTPSIPRKSLGEVFALGRTSTSSRYDSTSSRSVTPSSKSTRSATSIGTMRGPWTHGFGHSTLAPPHPATSPRPCSEDLTLNAELGYVIAIESGDDTIRCRPDLPPAEPPPRFRDSHQTIIESSRENLSQMTLSPTETSSPTLPEFVPNTAQPPNSNLTNHSGNVARRRQSPVPPIAIPPHGVPIDPEAKKALATVINPKGENQDALPTAFPFTPIDDRSDITSSTNNTPHSSDRSRVPPSVPPPLPSPSPRPETNIQDGYPFMNALPPLGSPVPGATGDTSKRGALEPSSAANLNTIRGGTASVPEKPPISEGYSTNQLLELPQNGTLGSTAKVTSSSAMASPDFGSKPSKSALGLVAEESRPISHHVPKVEVSKSGTQSIDSDPYANHLDRHSYLLSTLGTPVNNSARSATHSVQDPDRSDMCQAASQNPLAPGSTLSQDRSWESVSQSSTSPVKDLNEASRYLNTIEDDLATLLSPRRFSPPSDGSNPEQRQLHTPASAHIPLPSASLTPQPSPLQRGGNRLPLYGTPSPSALTSRVNDLLSPKSSAHIQHGSPIERNARSLNGSPMLSPGKLSSSGSWGAEQANYREVMTTPNNPTRLFPRRSPSVNAAITRKRSASFDLSGSPTFTRDTRDTSDPFAAHSIGSKRTDWLGPRTAKAFAAAGLLDKDRERSGLYSGPRSDTPSHRGGALNSWRTHGERNGGFGTGAGSVRSHSRLGSEIISPSFRARSLAGGDSSPSYRRSSLDHTAPPSPVSTHRTLVSSATSSSQSQSALQNMRERHELETEALLLALAGSKRTERDLRAENDDLMTYITQLERRVAILEVEKEQAERSQSRAREYRWNTPSPSDVETLDKRRHEILAGRSSTRGWSTSNKSAVPGSRSPLYGRAPLSAGMPRSASAASVYRSTVAAEPEMASPKSLSTADSRTPPRNPSLVSVSTPTRNNANQSPVEGSTKAHEDFDDWSEHSFNQSSPRLEVRNRLSSHSVASLVPQMPGNMSMLVHEQPEGEFGEDEISFRSASPSSMAFVHPRSNTPKPTPANISPVTADFSFNSIPGSPRSLRLGPEEEMHLADLISLQGLEIIDVLSNLDA
ncbi:unnamed protein product [Rhizoctonia solani]|uniref:Uncharacterized protein n=1 Tax=Rhizoctonia solani TaxID=456999 RepID=A0A8H3HTX2_9AGAM|nr:unnamed protein product [Rhizoctonia solani]